MDEKEKRPQAPQNNLGHNNQGQNNQVTLYDAICSNCNKPTKVVFPPEKGRPVYCKSCLKKMKDQKEQNRDNKEEHNQNSKLFPEEIKLTDIPFHSPKKNPENKRQENRHSEDKKRKEINLSELKKALEESLAPTEDKEKIEMEQEKQMDVIEKEEIKLLVVKNDKKDDSKKIIKPGETIKF